MIDKPRSPLDSVTPAASTYDSGEHRETGEPSRGKNRGEDKPVTAQANGTEQSDAAEGGLIGEIDPPGAPHQGDLPIQNVDPKKASLVTMALLAVAYTLYFAQSILFPIAFALLLALLFRPAVRWLHKFRIPESIGAAVILLFVLGVTGLALYEVAQPATEFVESVPNQLQAADAKIKTLMAPVQQISSALKTGEKLASGEMMVDAATAEPGDGAAEQAAEEEPPAAGELGGTPIIVREQQPPLANFLVGQTKTLIAASVLSLVLLYFLLANGDDVINNVLHTLPTIREKRGVVELVYAAEAGMSRYLLTVTLINAGLGVCVTIAMAILQMPNPLLWGAMAFAFNFIPYVGAIVGMLAVFLVSFLTFKSVGYAVLPPLAYFSLTTIEGNFVTPNVLGKQISLNPVIVFLALAFWGWIWGVGGAIIAVPMLAMLKIVCEQFKPLQPIATLLSS